MNLPINELRTFSCELSKENLVVMTHNLQCASRNVSYDVLLLNARSRQSLVAMRSLGSRGLRMAALESFDGLPIPAFSSRWCQHKALCPADEGTKEYLTYLEQVLDSTHARVLIPLRYDYLDWRDPFPVWMAMMLGFPRYLVRRGKKLPNRQTPWRQD